MLHPEFAQTLLTADQERYSYLCKQVYTAREAGETTFQKYEIPTEEELKTIRQKRKALAKQIYRLDMPLSMFFGKTDFDYVMLADLPVLPALLNLQVEFSADGMFMFYDMENKRYGFLKLSPESMWLNAITIESKQYSAVDAERRQVYNQIVWNADMSALKEQVLVTAMNSGDPDGAKIHSFFYNRNGY